MKYSVCFTDKDGFDWCIVNDFDNAILYGVGNLPAMADIVEAANRWRDYVEAQPTAPALLAALKPFAHLWEQWMEAESDNFIVRLTDSGPVTVGDIRAARAAIAAAEGGE